MSKTKEEILSSKAVYISEGETTGIKSDVLSAMDEYAKQEAIEFAEYINGCGYIEYDGYDRWHSPTMSTQVLSTSQLYQLFINSKTK